MRDPALATLEAPFGGHQHSVRLPRGFQGRSGRGKLFLFSPAIPLHLEEETWVRFAKAR